MNALGENVSLTSEEYDEYLSISNQIAETVPDMVSGFDSAGNAILSCKDNVSALTDAYNDLIRAQNNVILTSAKDIFGDFHKQALEAQTGTDGTLLGDLKFDLNKLTQSGVDALSAVLSSPDLDKAISEYIGFNTPIYRKRQI